MLRGLALTAFVALATGCALNPQTVNIVPHPAIITSNEGRGVAVAVRVIDERPSSLLGAEMLESMARPQAKSRPDRISPQ